MTGMTLAKATKDDFKAMWKVSKLVQDYGQQFYPDDDSPRAIRMKNLLMARLDELGTGGFMRIVMGCEMLIAECCDPTADHYALKPVLGAGPEMLEVLQSMNHMGGDDRGGYCICPLQDGSAPEHKHASICSDARSAIAKAVQP